jgi:RNA polymerase sigma factor (sigma-70 family)
MDPEQAFDTAVATLPFEQLVQALRQGDAAAWAQALDRVLPRVRDALRSRFGSVVAQSENAGGEALASACRTVYSNIARGRYELANWDDLAGLFITIASNKCKDRLRKQQRVVNWTDLPDPLGEDDARPAGGPSPEAESLRAEARGELKHAIDLVRRRLKRGDVRDGGVHAEIFRLRLEGVLGVREIASQVGCAERTVNRVWSEAREQLRKMLDESLVDDLGG